MLPMRKRNATVSNVRKSISKKPVLKQHLPVLVPKDLTKTRVLPVQQIPITSRTATIQAYDPNYVNPYVQNLTLSVTRDVNSHLTLDARYIGTLTRKNYYIYTEVVNP